MTSIDASSLQRARALLDLRRYDEVIALLGPLAVTQTSDAEPYVLLARALTGAHRLREALGIAERACAIAPESDYAHRVRADILRLLGRKRESLHAAQRAAELAPESALSHWSVTVAATRAGKKQLARDSARRVGELAPESALALEAKGWVELQDKHWPAAETTYRRALQLTPNSPTLLNNLGKAILNQGRADEAMELFRRAGQMDASSDLYLKNAAVAAKRSVWGPLQQLGGSRPAQRAIRVALILGFFAIMHLAPVVGLGVFVIGLAVLYARERGLSEWAQRAVKADARRRRQVTPLLKEQRPRTWWMHQEVQGRKWFLVAVAVIAGLVLAELVLVAIALLFYALTR